MKVILYFLYQLLPYYVIVLIRGLFQELTYDNCWRALARQKPILYDSEKKPKLSDVRSETCAVGYLIILPVEFNNSTIELHVATRRKKSLQLYCTVYFDFLSLMRFDMTCDVTLRDCSSFGKLTNSCYFNNVSLHNKSGNPSTKGFVGLLNQILAFVTFFSQVKKNIVALLLFHKIPFTVKLSEA